MKVAYLACEMTMQKSTDGKSLACEHDQMISALEGPFVEQGMQVCPVAWDTSEVVWADYGCALIGTTWDYVSKKDEFIHRLREIEGKTPLLNPATLVEWNIQKTYLKELQEKGAPVIETLWVDDPESSKIVTAFDELEADEIVVKLQVGAGAVGQHRLNRESDIPELSGSVMIQPFMPTIALEGEYSFIFVDGNLSHTLVKRPASGDYRIQAFYGGVETAVDPRTNDYLAAKGVMDLLDDTPLYARVDMVRDSNNKLRLMELELIEPFLYPLQGKNLGEVMAKAVKSRLKG